jgi:hypothetical protein
MRDKVIFVGCSYTAGTGWVDLPSEQSIRFECKEHPDLWVNICHREISPLQNLELINIGQSNASNTDIFENLIQALSEHENETKYVICQWTAMPRYNFQVGFETWETSESLNYPMLFGRPKHDVNLNKGISWPRKYINDLLDRLLVLHHLHWEILKVVKYTASISKLCKKFGIKLVFINGVCPWDSEYFTIIPENSKPEDLTSFTKKEILNINTRNDEEIWQLYYLAHQDYQIYGGIDPKQWINLYDPWHKKKIDTNYDKLHPGILSNQMFASQVKEFFLNFI